MATATVTPGLSWETKEVNDGLLQNLRATAEKMLSPSEGFTSLVAIRHESPKSDLTKIVFKMKGPQDVLLGAPGVDNFTFYKPSGDFQGSIVFYKDKAYFVSSLVYRITALAIKPEQKKAEIDKIANEIKAKVLGKGFTFNGTLDSFSIGTQGTFNSTFALEFLSSLKEIFAGQKLRNL